MESRMRVEDSALCTSQRHGEHDVSWCVVSTLHQSGVCVACLVEQLEDQSLSGVHRKLVLSVFSSILKEVTEVVAIFRDNLVLSRHVVNILTTLFQDDYQFVEPAVEACYNLLKSVQSEELVQYVMSTFHDQLQSVCNLKPVKPFLLLVGQLVASNEAFGAHLLMHHESLLLDLTSLEDTPEEDVQSGIIFLLIHVFHHSLHPLVSTILKHRVCSLLINTLSDAESLDLQINLLALLKKLVRDCESSTLLIQLSPNNKTLILALKKLFIAKKEVMQTAAAQCILGLLNSGDTALVVNQLLESDVTEFLFESLHTQSGAQLESLFKVLHVLTSYDLFFTRCHAVYGVESVLMAIGVVINMKNTSILEQAFMLLECILECQPSSIPLFVNTSTALHCLSTVEHGLHSNHLPVFIQVLRCTQHVLREEYLPHPYPYLTVMNMMKTATSKLDDMTDLPSQELIHIYSKLISAASRLCKRNAVSTSTDCELLVLSNNSVSETQDVITDIKQCLLQVAEQHILHWICKLWDETDSMVHREIFYSFNSLYRMDKSKMATFSTRVAESNIIVKVIIMKSLASAERCDLRCILDEFLVNVLTQLVERDVFKYTVFPAWLQHGLHALSLSDWCVAELVQVRSKETSQAVLAVLYFSCIHRCILLSAEDLLQVIQNFLVTCPDINSLPPLTLKFCFFLCAWAQSNVTSTDDLCYTKAFRDLLSMLWSCPVKVWYTNHPAVMMWSFSNSLLSDTLGTPLLEYWLPTINMDNFNIQTVHDDDVDMIETLISSVHFLNTLLRLVIHSTEEVSNKVVHIIQWIISKLKEKIDEPDSVLIMNYLYEECSELLHNVFLQQTKSPDYQLSNLLGLLTCLVTEQNKEEDAIHWDVKSAYHVVKHIGNVSNVDSPSLYQSLLYLLKFSEQSQPEYHRVVPVMTQNENFMRKMNKCLTSTKSELVNTVSRIISWMSAYPGQIHVTCPIYVSADYILKSLANNCTELNVGLLNLISAALTSDKHNTGALVFTKNSILEDIPFFTARDVRLLYFHLQQFVCQDDIRVRKLAVDCVQKLLKYAETVHGDLETQLLCHSWNKLWLETLLQFEYDCGLSEQTASLVIAICSKPEGEHLISQICDIFLQCLSASDLTPQCAAVLSQAHLLERPFIIKSSEQDLITSAKENLRKTLSAGCLATVVV